MHDLILVCKTTKELGIVLDIQTKKITVDDIILPMRDINSLTKSKMEKAWAVNNSMEQTKQYARNNSVSSAYPRH